MIYKVAVTNGKRTIIKHVQEKFELDEQGIDSTLEIKRLPHNQIIVETHVVRPV